MKIEKVFCDRCGTEVIYPCTRKLYLSKNGREDGLDLCDNCHKELNDWFINKLIDYIDYKELDKIPTVEAISKADIVIILDKIRAEIEEYKSRQLTMGIGIENLEKGKQIALEYVLAILDKYKAESEVAE